MKHYFVGIMIAALMILLNGCTPTSGTSVPEHAVQRNEALPSWYVNPPGDNRNSYFGAGDGRTKREAQNNALSQIASKISLNLKSTMQSSQRSYRTRHGSSDIESSREIREQKIVSAAKEIEFSNINVMNTAFLNNRFYTLVEVDRAELFNRYSEQLIRLDGKIAKKYTYAGNQPLFNQILLLDALEKEMDAATLKFALLKSLNPSFDESSFYQHFDKIHAENQKLRSRLVVGFKPTKATAIETSVKEHLAALGIETVSAAKVLKSRKRSDIAVVAIEKKAKEQHFKTTNVQLADLHFAQVSIGFIVYDVKGRVLARNTVQVRNASKKSFADAAQKRDKFDQLAEEEGILTLIGGK